MNFKFSIKKILCIIILMPLFSYSQINMKVEYNIIVKKDSNQLENKAARFKAQQIEREIEALNFNLNFKNNASLFKLDEKLHRDNDWNYRMAKSFVSGKYQYYTDLEQKLMIGDIFGEESAILQDRQKYSDWNITKETKTILDYQCFKATTAYEEMGNRGEPKQIYIEAWFTPDIPVNAGPLDIDGLPGLILEGYTNPRYVFKASAINFDNEEEIVKPKFKKILSNQEYMEKLSEVIKEIRSRG